MKIKGKNNDGAERKAYMPDTLLVVEDDEGLSRLIQKNLQRAGFRAEGASNGAAAVAWIVNNSTPLLLLDYRLPDMTGIEVMETLAERGCNVPSLVMTGHGDEKVAVEMMKLGARDYLVKDAAFLDLLPSVVKRVARELATEKQLANAEEELRAKNEELEQSLHMLRQALDGAVQAMALIVEARDPYTAGHQRRVTELTCAIAKEMAFPESQIDGIRMAAVIHDIGKIGVPAEILSKPGQLTQNEFSLVKTHPQVSYDILKEIQFPCPIAQIVLQHHESMDGSGYPAGLSGEDILPEARILGLADVVEALASHRPYRPALGIDKALEEISQNKGILYDPEVVDVCLKLFAQNGFKFE